MTGPGEVRRVSDIMTTEVVTIRPHETLSRAQRLMRERRIHAVPVLDDFDRLLGIVTTTDLLQRGAEGERTTVGAVMTRRVFVLSPDANLGMLARLMKRWRIHHVVVTEEVGKVRGIVSVFDLLGLVEELGTRAAPRPTPPPRQPPPPKPPRPRARSGEPAVEVECPSEDPEARALGLTFVDINPSYADGTRPTLRLSPDPPKPNPKASDA